MEYTVRAPDGSAIKVEAPEGASDADLIRLAQTQMNSAGLKPASKTEKFLASGVGRTAKGLKDPFDSGAQLLPRALSFVSSAGGMLPNKASEWLDSEAARVDTDINDSERDFQVARWKAGQDGFDGARLLGNVFNPATVALAKVLPGGAATTLGRAFKGGISGAVSGAAATPVVATADTSFGLQKMGQGAMGMLGGSVAAPILGKTADVVAPLVKRIQAKLTAPDVLGARASMSADDAIDMALREIGAERSNIPQQVIDTLRKQVLDSFKRGQKFDAAAQLRKHDFEALDLPALRGQITRNPAQYSRDMNVRGIEGVGEKVQSVLTTQNQGITQRLTGLGGPKAAEKFDAGTQFVGRLKTLDEDMAATVRRAYQNARASSGKDWDVPLKGLAQDVQAVVDDFGVGAEKNAIPSAVHSRLKALGIVSDPGMTQRKVFNYEEADKLLKQINAHDDGMNGSISALRASVKKAILEGGGDGDPFAPARRLAAERFSLHDAAPALKAVVQGKAAPDDFVDRYITNGKVNELKALSKLLTDAEMSEAKKQIARVIYEGAFKGNVSGDKAASPAGLQQAMKKLPTEKLKVFFSQSEIDDLNRLVRVSAYANTEPAWGTVARGGNPGGVLLGGVAKLGGAGAAAGKALPLLSAVLPATQNSLRASAALDTSIKKSANLTPEEIAAISRLLGLSSVAGGAAFAPRP